MYITREEAESSDSEQDEDDRPIIPADALKLADILFLLLGRERILDFAGWIMEGLLSFF